MYISKANRYFFVSNFAAGAGFTAYANFMVSYCEELGFTSSQSGIIMTIFMAGLFIMLPVLGYLNDNYITTKKTINLLLLASAVASTAFMFVPKTFLTVAIFMFYCSCFYRPVGNILDNFVSTAAQIRSDVDYGIPRSGGSLGYAVFSLLLGFLISKFGFNVMFIAQLVTLLIFYIGNKNSKEVPLPKKAKAEKTDIIETKETEISETNITETKVTETSETNSEDMENLSLKKSLSILAKNRNYVLIILSSLLWNVGVIIFTTYIPLYLSSIGGSVSILGTVLFVMSMAEMPVFMMYNKINRRINENLLLVISVFFIFTKLFFVTLIPKVSFVIAFQLLQPFGYTLFMPSFLKCIYKTVPREITNLALNVGTMIYFSFAGMLGILLGGFLIEKTDVFFSFWVATGFTFLSFIVIVINFMLELKAGHEVVAPTD